MTGIKPPQHTNERTTDPFRVLDRAYHVCALQLARQQGMDEASVTQSIIELARAQPGFLGFALTNRRTGNDLYTYWESMDGMREWHRDLDVLRTLSPASDRWFGRIRLRIAAVESSSQPWTASPTTDGLTQARPGRRRPSNAGPDAAFPTNVTRNISGSC